MSNLKLTIELIPKGAWGNNLRERLAGKEWDTLRNICYSKAKNRCAICGKEDSDLEAHEVWEFEINAQTQTLVDIIALCPACHGVKHIRNSERIGYGKHSKSHFIKTNNCSELMFGKHYAEAQFLFEERNEVLRWKLKADLASFGGEGFEIKEKEIPLIINPYEEVDMKTVKFTSTNITSKNDNVNSQSYLPLPKIYFITVNNYEGTINVDCGYTNKIQWLGEERILKTKYNIIGKFNTEFSVAHLTESSISFVLIGDGGETYSQCFKLEKVN